MSLLCSFENFMVIQYTALLTNVSCICSVP